MSIHLIQRVIRSLRVVVCPGKQLDDVLKGAAPLLLVATAPGERTDALDNGLEDIEDTGTGLVIVLSGAGKELGYRVVSPALLPVATKQVRPMREMLLVMAPDSSSSTERARSAITASKSRLSSCNFMGCGSVINFGM